MVGDLWSFIFLYSHEVVLTVLLITVALLGFSTLSSPRVLQYGSRRQANTSNYLFNSIFFILLELSVLLSWILAAYIPLSLWLTFLICFSMAAVYFGHSHLFHGVTFNHWIGGSHFHSSYRNRVNFILKTIENPKSPKSFLDIWLAMKKIKTFDYFNGLLATLNYLCFSYLLFQLCFGVSRLLDYLTTTVLLLIPLFLAYRLTPRKFFGLGLRQLYFYDTETCKYERLGRSKTRVTIKALFAVFCIVGYLIIGQLLPERFLGRNYIGQFDTFEEINKKTEEINKNLLLLQEQQKTINANSFILEQMEEDINKLLTFTDNRRERKQYFSYLISIVLGLFTAFIVEMVKKRANTSNSDKRDN